MSDEKIERLEQENETLEESLTIAKEELDKALESYQTLANCLDDVKDRLAELQDDIQRALRASR